MTEPTPNPTPTPAQSSPQTTSKPGGLAYHHRVFVAGQSDSGKSVLINHLATRFRCQRLLYDTKDEWTIPGVTPVYRVEHIDWKQPVIHLIDESGNLDDTDRLFRICWTRKVGRSENRSYGLVVIVHELGDLCGDSPGRTPRWLSNYIRKGDAHGLGLIAGAQRPYNIPKVARTEAKHVFSMARGCDPADIPVMAGLHRMTVPEYERALEQAHELGEYAYIQGNRATRTNVIRPPLPELMLRRTLARNIGQTRRSGTSGAGSGVAGSPEQIPEYSGIDSGTSALG
jgi:hypothetical protein